MNEVIIKNDKNIKIASYGYKEFKYYIMTIKEKALYFAYKKTLAKQFFTIKKVFFLENTIKICYKKGFNILSRTEYFNKDRKIGILDLMDIEIQLHDEERFYVSVKYNNKTF